MKTVSAIFLIVGSVAICAAQESASPDPQPQANYRSNNNRTLSTLLAYGSFSVAGEERFGPMLMVQYSPALFSKPSVDFFGGILFRAGSSTQPVDAQGGIPLASYYVPYYSPYSNYHNDNFYRMPNFSIGVGFVGADLTFYMAEGEVRPYVGLGGSLAFWTYSSRLGSTVAPDAKAGLNIHLSNSFSGFVEARRMFAVPNLLDLSAPKFDGLTSVALGLSFAPRIR